MSSSNEFGAALYRDVLGRRFGPSPDRGPSKVTSLAEAIQSHVRAGMSLHFLGLHYRSHAAVHELVRRFMGRRPGFTIVAGTLHGPVMSLFHAKLVDKAICAFIGEAYPTMGPNPVYNRLFQADGVVFENWSFLSFTLRLLAGALGVGFLPTRSLVGSDMAGANEPNCRPVEDPFGAVSGLAAVRSLNPDLTFVHGQAADEFGNTILLPPRGEDVYGALGSRQGVIVTVEKIVPTDYIRRHSSMVRLPGVYVKAVVEAPLGAHPSGLNNHGLPEIDGYAEDIPFYIETRQAARDPETFDAWIDNWILSCRDHGEYLGKLGRKRVDLLKGRAHPDAWQQDLTGKLPAVSKRSEAVSPLERAVLAAADLIREKVRQNGDKLILCGAGLASLAAWVAIYGLKEEGVEAELISELGFYGFSPRPGEPFLFNLSNIPTCKGLDGILTTLGMMTTQGRPGCLGALSAAQVDRHGNLNTTVIQDKKFLITGSGGANDVMSVAREVVLIMPQSRERFVPELSFVTSPGAAARTLVSDLGVFEKLGDDPEFTLTAYFDDKSTAGTDAAIRSIKERCGWNLRVIHHPARFPLPEAQELATLRLFDPDRYFLKD
ncbi:MAG: hypothetical protein KJ621_01325 [Proteobacteria bacterium]|nr:hypothetical protein [Pseudomonadota bacterium]MBU1740686.1 hypothetical protein [Pseudomonadota bacterium]